MRRIALSLALLPAVVAAGGAAFGQEPPAEGDNGPVEEFWPNGNPKLTATLKNGERDGVCTEFHEGGGKARVAAYRQGVLHGAFNEWYEGGTPRRSAQYRDGALHGGYTEYFENGKPRLSANYRDGVRHGASAEYLDTGKKTLAAGYAKGLPDGTWTRWDEQGRKLDQCEYRAGLRDGDYQAFHPNGKRRLLIQYRRDRLHGAYTEFDEKGALAAPPLQFADERLFPRRKEAITTQLAAFQQTEAQATRLFAEEPSTRPMKAGVLAPEHLAAGLARLRSYRYLAGVPHETLTLNPRYNDEAQHGAVLLAKIGHLDHEPQRPPDVSEEFYKVAYAGTSSGNIWGSAGARGTLVDAVTSFLDDSDASNIDRLGHRRWCLNPFMGQTGFGFFGGFAVLWAFDKSAANVPDWDFVAFPPSGYFPEEYWGARWAWSVTLNPKRFPAPADGAVTFRVFPLDEHYRKTGPALELDYQRVDRSGYGGIGNCLIFRPRQVAPGRYWVELGGVRAANERDRRLVYIVEFFRLSG